MLKNQFCEKVLEFLRAEYDDSYTFKIDRRITAPLYLAPDSGKMELIVTSGLRYRLIVTNENMRYLFKLYCQNEFIQERNQYQWQKELIEMIEGG